MNHDLIDKYTQSRDKFIAALDSADWALALSAEIRALPETVECPECELEQF